MLGVVRARASTANYTRESRRWITGRRKAAQERQRRQWRQGVQQMLVERWELREAQRLQQAKEAQLLQQQQQQQKQQKGKPIEANSTRKWYMRIPGVQSLYDYYAWVKPAFAPLSYPPGYDIPYWYRKKYTLEDFRRGFVDGTRMYIRSFKDPDVVDHGILDPKELERKMKKEEKEMDELAAKVKVTRKQAQKGLGMTRSILEGLRDGMTSFVEGYKEGRVQAMADIEEDNRKRAKEGKRPRGISSFLLQGDDEDAEKLKRSSKFTLNKYRKLRADRVRIAREIKEKAEEEAEEALWDKAEAELKAEAAAEVARREAAEAERIARGPQYETGVGSHKRRRAAKRFSRVLDAHSDGEDPRTGEKGKESEEVGLPISKETKRDT
ncbi:Hypothetical Protein FCC1311_013782 [Hondaea fermentalgiana]|uniref:Uncharacterized protein n=1 Tax=Hondaea fermentalgiana TaxID=2315210 RepID=A0A2R5GAP7_9STRA|nr:Hypothetical Protein FCC1311_013782 [Hondaea fermentalgiana]|eukprot:GBG25161.1 Hypothetical Protein FCC1311_013782 [Hondaea fermentalgiana]